MKNIIGTFLLALILFSACTKEELLPEASRIFRPTSLKEGLTAPSNYIEAKWLTSKEAISYRVEISTDTFKTIVSSIVLDTNYVLFPNLKYDQLYQVQVQGIAADTLKNSKFAYLGAIKTPKFPTILISPTIADFSDASVKMKWVAAGAEVTGIKVYAADKTTLLKEITLTSTDITNQYKVITGLDGATSYYMELYSGTTLRGYDVYTTKAPFAGIVIDLREITDRPSVLQDTLPTIPSGSTVVLKKGLTYNISATTSLSKTVTITSGTDLLVDEPPTIFFTSNFLFAAGSAIDSISFVNVHLKGSDATAKYVFNNTNSASVDKVKFDNCKIELFRGIMRLQSASAIVNNYEINNSIVDSIGGYGILTVGVNTSKVQNVIFRNSTISRTEVIITSSVIGANSVNIESCTFHKSPISGNAIANYGSSVITSGVKFNNCILSVAKPKTGVTTPPTTKGVIAVTGTTIDASGNYATSDFTSGGNAVQYTPYTRPSTDIFTDPLNLDFKIKDITFPGRSTAGDPRWRL